MQRLLKIGTLILTSYGCAANATQVFDLEGFGAISRSMGGTSASIYTGNAALISNPATLSLSPSEKQFEVGIDFITTDIDLKDANGEKASSDTHSKNRGPYIAPQLSYVTQVEKWRFGGGVFANGGLGTEFGSDSFLSRTENGTQTDFENSSRLLVLRAPVGFSYQKTPKLSFGASADLVWTSLNLELLLPASQVGALAAGGNLSGPLVGPLAGFVGADGAAHFSLTRNQPTGGAVDSFGFGGRVGFTYQTSNKTTFGGAYNFETSVGDLEGNATLSGVNGTGGTLPLDGDIKIKDFDMPASLTLGVSHLFTDQLLITADVKRSYWSDVMEDINVSFSSAAGDIDITLPHNYQDITIASIGAAYQYNNRLVLRAGYSYAEQALEERLILPVIPAYLKEHLTFGGTYKFDARSALNLALSFGLKEDRKTPSYVSGSEQLTQSHSQVNSVVSYSTQF